MNNAENKPSDKNGSSFVGIKDNKFSGQNPAAKDAKSSGSDYLSEQIKVLMSSIERDIRNIKEKDEKQKREIKQTAKNILNASRQLEQNQHPRQIKFQNQISESKKEIENIIKEIEEEERSIDRFKAMANENGILSKYQNNFSSIEKGLNDKKDNLYKSQEDYQKLLKTCDNFYKELRLDIIESAIKLYFEDAGKNITKKDIDFWKDEAEKEKNRFNDEKIHSRNLKLLKEIKDEFSEIESECDEKIKEINSDFEDILKDPHFLSMKDQLATLEDQLKKMEEGVFSFESRLAKKDAEIELTKKDLKDFISEMEIGKRMKEVLLKAKDFNDKSKVLKEMKLNGVDSGYESEQFRSKKAEINRERDSLQGKIKNWYKDLRDKIQEIKNLAVEEFNF